MTRSNRSLLLYARLQISFFLNPAFQRWGKQKRLVPRPVNGVQIGEIYFLLH